MLRISKYVKKVFLLMQCQCGKRRFLQKWTRFVFRTDARMHICRMFLSQFIVLGIFFYPIASSKFFCQLLFSLRILINSSVLFYYLFVRLFSVAYSPPQFIETLKSIAVYDRIYWRRDVRS